MSRADFAPKSATFSCPTASDNCHARMAPERVCVETAEFIGNSAVPSEGSMRTSWPALHNGCCRDQSRAEAKRHIGLAGRHRVWNEGLRNYEIV